MGVVPSNLVTSKARQKMRAEADQSVADAADGVLVDSAPEPEPVKAVAKKAARKRAPVKKAAARKAVAKTTSTKSQPAAKRQSSSRRR